MYQTIQKRKKKYYTNLDRNNNTNSKNVWKTVKPFLTDREKSTEHNNFKNKEIISEEKDVPEELNTFFHNAVKSLGISENPFTVVIVRTN